jgi:hypothetical protein
MPNIACIGSGKFNTQGSLTITLPRPIIGGKYLAFITGDGGCGGAMARSGDMFSVIKKTDTSFVVQSNNGNCKASIDYLVITP